MHAVLSQGVRLAQKFEALVLSDPRFEIPAKRHLGMVVFRLVGDNELTERLLKRINSNGRRRHGGTRWYPCWSLGVPLGIIGWRLTQVLYTACRPPSRAST